MKEILLLWGLSFFVFNQKTLVRVANTNWFLRTKVFEVGEERKPNMAVRQEVEELMN